MKITVIDIETTGFLNKGGKICEIGIVELDLANGKKKIVFDNVINPEVTDNELLNSWIVQNNYMTIKEIRSGVSIESVKDEVQLQLDKREGSTAFNREFDLKFLESEGIEIKKRLPCPMLISTEICKLPSKNGGPFSFKWPKAQEAYDFFFPNSGYVEIHRGADDAFHEADIIYKLHTLGKFI